MNYIICLLLYYLNSFIILAQNDIYCDKTTKCDSCTICGQKDENYCSCNFNNSYCLDNDNNYNFLSNFLFKYDGCQKVNGERSSECGASHHSIDSSTNLEFKSTDNENFVCYYNLESSENRVFDITVKIGNQDKKNIDLNAHFLFYKKDGEVKMTHISLINPGEIPLEENNNQYISLYLDISNGTNLDKFNIYFEIQKLSETITSYVKTSSTTPSKGLIYGIVIGALGIVIIIAIICIIRRKINQNKLNQTTKDSDISTNVNTGLNGSVTNPHELKIINKKIDNIFRNELIPKNYYKKDVINDCYKCTICLEEFKEPSSIVITTKCGHTYHYSCFKKWIYNNIEASKCPNCNNEFLGDKSINYYPLRGNDYIISNSQM